MSVCVEVLCRFECYVVVDSRKHIVARGPKFRDPLKILTWILLLAIVVAYSRTPDESYDVAWRKRLTHAAILCWSIIATITNVIFAATGSIGKKESSMWGMTVRSREAPRNPSPRVGGCVVEKWSLA